jgi:hypothetical protein
MGIYIAIGIISVLGGQKCLSRRIFLSIKLVYNLYIMYNYMSCQVEYIALVTGLIVLISEALPFLDTKCNGLLHGLHGLINSDCCKNDYIPDEKDIEIIKQTEQTEQKPEDKKEAILSIDSDSEDSYESSSY